MLWALKRTVSFEHPKHMLKTMGKNSQATSLVRQLVFQILEQLSYIPYRPFVYFDALPPGQQFFSHVGMNKLFVPQLEHKRANVAQDMSPEFLQSCGVKLISLSLQFKYVRETVPLLTASSNVYQQCINLKDLSTTGY